MTATTGLSHHDWHLLLGVLLTLGFTWLLRLPLDAWAPLLIVLALELVNEAVDFTRYHIDGYPWAWSDDDRYRAHNAVPLAIVLVARWDSLDFYCFRRRPHGMIRVALR